MAALVTWSQPVRSPAAGLSSAVGIAVLVLVLVAPAAAAGLEQLGCLTSDPGRPAACAPIHGFYTQSSFAAELSGDGRSAYLASESGLAVFDRDAGTGALRQLDGAAGCHKDIPDPDCTPVEAGHFDDAQLQRLVLSSDDRHAYAVFLLDNLEDGLSIPFVLAWARDPATGGLTALPGPGPCDRSVFDRRCGAHGQAIGSVGLSISPDGRHLYLASSGARTVTVFARDPNSGALTLTGCVTSRPSGRCAHTPGPFYVSGLSLSPDGRNAYAATSAYVNRRGKLRPGTVVALSRDEASGMLAPLAGAARCVRDGGRGGCRRGRGQFDPDRTTVSPDGRNVYATGSESLTVYRRDPATGALRQLGGRVRLRAVRIPVGLTIAPDGTRAYLGSGNGAIAVLRRTPTGRLIQIECVTRRRTAGCERARISPLPFTVRLSPDGRFAYAGGERVVGVLRVGPAAQPAPD